MFIFEYLPNVDPKVKYFQTMNDIMVQLGVKNASEWTREKIETIPEEEVNMTFGNHFKQETNITLSDLERRLIHIVIKETDDKGGDTNI